MQKLRAAIALPGEATRLRQRLETEFLHADKIFTIQVPLKDFGIPGDLNLGKEIVVNARLGRDDLGLNDQFHVEFKATRATALFPTFRGILDIFPDELQGGSILEVIGQYQPPLGMMGLAIDTTIGYLIAQRSATSFLSEVAQAICVASSSSFLPRAVLG